MIPGYTHYCFGCFHACQVNYTWQGKRSRCCSFTVSIDRGKDYELVQALLGAAEAVSR